MDEAFFRIFVATILLFAASHGCAERFDGIVTFEILRPEGISTYELVSAIGDEFERYPEFARLTIVAIDNPDNDESIFAAFHHVSSREQLIQKLGIVSIEVGGKHLKVAVQELLIREMDSSGLEF